MKDAVTLINEFLDTQESERLKIAVIGDAMLDQFYDVKVNRISPEFPIPVMLSEDMGPALTMPGGATNVAYQFNEFNVDCTYFGCTDSLAAIKLSDYKFKTVIEPCDAAVIPRKRRFFDQDLPLCRWDVERKWDQENEELILCRKSLMDKFENYVYGEDPDIVILSDYNKGFFADGIAQEIIEICDEYDVPTLVDPKKPPLDQWEGCTIFKPNLKEADGFCEDQYYEDIKRLVNCEALVITRSNEGVQTFTNNSPPILYQRNEPTEGHPLGYSGAGDCFAAVYAIAYALNFNFKECSVIANDAASLYVQTRLNDPVSPLDMRIQSDTTAGKIVEPHELHHLPDDTILSFTNGCFDIVHPGHVSVIEAAKTLGDVLIVGIDADENVRHLKGEDRPIHGLDQRMRVIASMEAVDYVVPFSGDVYNLIEKLPHITFLVKGGDWTADKVIGADLVDEVVIHPRTIDCSTSQTIRKVQCQDTSQT